MPFSSSRRSKKGFALGAVGLLALLTVCDSDMNMWGEGGSFDRADKSRLLAVLTTRIRGGGDCVMTCDEYQTESELRAFDDAFSCSDHCAKALANSPSIPRRACKVGSEVTSQESHLAEGKLVHSAETAAGVAGSPLEDNANSPGASRSRYPNRRSLARNHAAPLAGVYLPKVLGESRSVSDLSRGSSPHCPNMEERLMSYGASENFRLHKADIIQSRACSVFANDVVKIKLVGSVHDIDTEQKSFSPLFTHQIFGQREEITGYVNPKVEILYASNSLRPLIRFSSTSRHSEQMLQEHGLNATDVVNCIKRFVPCDYLSSTEDLRSELAKNPMQEIGLKVGGYNISHVVPRSMNEKETLAEDQFEFYFSSLENPEVHQFANRLQSLAMWMIEKSSYIKADPNWKLLTLYRRLKQKETKSQGNDGDSAQQADLELVGFVTIYKYLCAKDCILGKTKCKNDGENTSFCYRISQFVILPPFQRMGHGERLLRQVYELAVDSPQCFEVRIENPSQGFSKLRDATDARLLLEKMPELLVLPYPPFDDVQKRLKLTRAQIRHLWISIVKKAVKSLPVRNIPDKDFRFHNTKVANFEEEGFLCNVNGHKFFSGQFVRVARSDNTERLGHLVGINPWTKLIRLRWMYTSSDIPDEINSKLSTHLSQNVSRMQIQEVFYSFHEDFVFKEQLLGAVSVGFVQKPFKALETENQNRGSPQLFCRYVYDPSKFAMYKFSEKKLKPTYRHIINEVFRENSVTSLISKARERQATNGDEDVQHNYRPWMLMNSLHLERRNSSTSELAERNGLLGGDFSSLAYSESLSGSTSEIVPYSGVNSLFAAKPKRYIITRRNPRSRSHGMPFTENNRFQLSSFCLDKVGRVVMKKKFAGLFNGCRSRFNKKGKGRLLLGSAAASSQPIEDSLCLPSRACSMLFGNEKQVAYKLRADLCLEQVAAEWNHLLDDLCGCMLKHVSMIQSTLENLCSQHDSSYRGSYFSSGLPDQPLADLEAFDSMSSENPLLTQNSVIPQRDSMRSNLYKHLQDRCTHLLRRLSSRLDAAPFLEPVDPVRDGCPDYFQVIARPMDLGTVQTKLRDGSYPMDSAGLHDFFADIKLVFDNAMCYNPPSHSIHRQARRLFLSFLNAYRNVLSGNLNVLSKLTEAEAWKVNCALVLNFLCQERDAGPFLEPIGAFSCVAARNWNREEGVMDLSSIGMKLQEEGYKSPDEFVSDVQQTLEHAMGLFPPAHSMHTRGKRLLEVLEGVRDLVHM